MWWIGSFLFAHGMSPWNTHLLFARLLLLLFFLFLQTRLSPSRHTHHPSCYYSCFCVCFLTPHTRSKGYRWDIHLFLDEGLFLVSLFIAPIVWQNRYYYRTGLWWDFLGIDYWKGGGYLVMGCTLGVVS